MEQPGPTPQADYTFLRVLVVEDNPGDALLVEERLSEARDSQFQIVRAERLEEAIGTARDEPVDVALLDLGLPDSHGVETLRRFRDAVPDVPVIVLTGYADVATALEAVRAGAQDYLVKGPIDAKLLSRSILYALERHRVVAQLRDSQDRVRALLDRMQEGVLIAGPGGTVRFANPAARSVLGSEDDLLGTKLDLPDARDGTTRVELQDPSGKGAATRARVTAIDWEGRDAYLVTFPSAPDDAVEPGSPEPVRSS